MPLMSYNGGVLSVSNAVAGNADCCCDETPPPAGTRCINCDQAQCDSDTVTCTFAGIIDCQQCMRYDPGAFLRHFRITDDFAALSNQAFVLTRGPATPADDCFWENETTFDVNVNIYADATGCIGVPIPAVWSCRRRITLEVTVDVQVTMSYVFDSQNTTAKAFDGRLVGWNQRQCRSPENDSMPNDFIVCFNDVVAPYDNHRNGRAGTCTFQWGACV